MHRPPRSGFTLVELVVALAVAAILLGTAAPSFVEVVRDARLRSAVEPIRFALMHARSEAVKGARLVTVCPRAEARQCGDDWSAGTLAFVDSNAPADEALAVRDPDDPVVRDAPAGDADVVVSATGSATRRPGDAGPRAWIRFDGTGRASWGAGTIVACDERGAAHARALVVAPTGDVRGATPASSGGPVRDAFGLPVTCPAVGDGAGARNGVGDGA